MLPIISFQRIELFLRRYANLVFGISMLCFIIFSALLFNARIFLMGDDADYIMDGYHFVHQNIYPAGRASLYGIVLGCIMFFTGVHVVLLKLFSFACAVTGFFLLYKTFKDKIPYWLLFAMLFFTAVNSAILYYSSSNLSEAFFMMMQGVFFHAVFLLIKKQAAQQSFRVLLPYWCYAGIAGLLLSLSKNVAIVAPFALPVYYLLKKEYRHAGLAIAFFALFKIPYEWLLRLVYNRNTVVSQIGQILVKDPYHPENGQESFAGFFTRLYKNAGIYLSQDFVRITGLQIPHCTLPSFIGWGIILLLGSYGIWTAYRQNKYLFFSGIYLVVMLGVTFLVLQPDIAQTRLIIIYVPLLLGLLLYSAKRLFQQLFKRTGIFIIGALFAFMVCANGIASISTIQKNVPVLKQNLGGDPFYGYTPDWINYLNMGRFVMNTIPDSIMVAARKSTSLQIYCNGRPFYGICHVPDTATADGLLQELSRSRVRYLILASIRLYPQQANGEIISTLHRYVDVIKQKYPDKVKTIKQIGEQEPCSLVEIMY